MDIKSLSYYLLNCGWLLLPIMLWNMAFTSKLPRTFSTEFFEKDISAFTANGENFFRLMVFILPLLMPLRIITQSQKIGPWLYGAGSLIYFLSWVMLIRFPQGNWSRSILGFLAPTYTPLIFLAGIGLMGSSLYFPSLYKAWMFIVIAAIFVGFHVSHTLLIYSRIP